MAMQQDFLADRKAHMTTAGSDALGVSCQKPSVAGSVSQRACVFCGSRVVLYPIADALHLVHGPIGCAAYTWDIRGALSSGPELHRLSFSTDLQEEDVIFGGEPSLLAALEVLVPRYEPKAVFVYATCIVGLIGDDVDAVCRKFTAKAGIPVISVHSEGFKGTKNDGYRAACEALLSLVGTPLSTATTVAAKQAPTLPASPYVINILGEFNLAGEAWMLREYFTRIGITVLATLTGDGRVDDIRRSNQAKLNIVQCSGSMTWLAKEMQSRWKIPFKKVSFFGLEDTAEAMYTVARFFEDPEILERTRSFIASELGRVVPELARYKKDLEGKRAAIYVGGAFKSHSLVKALRHLGMKTVLVGSQTGNSEDYKALQELCDPGTIVVDDANPKELARFLLEKDAQLFIGGVKERPLAYKLGIGFCDHNHERKIALAGFDGMLNFAREVHESVMSPVWSLAPRYQGRQHENP